MKIEVYHSGLIRDFIKTKSSAARKELQKLLDVFTKEALKGLPRSASRQSSAIYPDTLKTPAFGIPRKHLFPKDVAEANVLYHVHILFKDDIQNWLKSTEDQPTSNSALYYADVDIMLGREKLTRVVIPLHFIRHGAHGEGKMGAEMSRILLEEAYLEISNIVANSK